MTPKEFFENAKRVADDLNAFKIPDDHSRDASLNALVAKKMEFGRTARTQVPVLAEAALVMLSALENASTATEDKFESCAHGWHSDWYNDILRDSDDYICPICESSGFGRRIRTAVPTEKAKAASETLARVAELVGAG